MFDMSRIDELNSATKYPSILTYHALGDWGSLTEELNVEFDGPTFLTEKIDGTNARIVLLPMSDDYFIGSREELLYARGDRLANRAQGIAAALKELAEGFDVGNLPYHLGIVTLYLEVYGGKVTDTSKQYSSKGTVGYRLFDVSVVPLEMLDQERQRIASWRDDGGQEFYDVFSLQDVSHSWNIPLVPYLNPARGSDIPTDVEGMAKFLTEYLPESQAPLDETAGKRPEGLVLRSADRTKIAKARFQDYERTLKRRNAK